MNTNEPYFGLDKNTYNKILSVLSAFDEVIEACILFGSRARGDNQSNSDFDFAIKVKPNMEGSLYKVSNAFEESNIIYTFDIINFEAISNDNLRSEIEKEGIVIYSSNGNEDSSVELNRIKMKFIDLKKASEKLEKVLERDYLHDDIIVDATIQRFEFTFELSWKLMKAMLEYDGIENVNSPRRAIRESFKQNYISDGTSWIKMLEDRNRTSHTYDEETALEIVTSIKGNYIELIKLFVQRAESELY